MEQEHEESHPNSTADAYRNLSPTDQPPIQDKQLEVVIIHKDGSLVLGASNMVDRYWNGSIWFYTDLMNFDRNQYTAATKTEGGVRIAAYLDKFDRFVVGEDSGLLSIFESVWQPETQAQELKCMGFSCQHDDSLTSVSTFNDNIHIVTGGMDSCIKVWDTTELLATASYNQAQLDVITCVQTKVNSDSVFLSTSMDSEALIWDIRKARPAIGFWNVGSDIGLTAASWKYDDENAVAIGGIDGSISIFDIRHTGIPIHKSIEFPRGVNKLSFSPYHSNQLAGCCDSTEIKVFDAAKNYEGIFKNSGHKDFVRCLAWYKNDLISCSWDNKILRHSISIA